MTTYRISKIIRSGQCQIAVIERLSQEGRWYGFARCEKNDTGKVNFHSEFKNRQGIEHDVPEECKMFVREQKREWFPRFWAKQARWENDDTVAASEWSNEHSMDNN